MTDIIQSKAPHVTMVANVDDTILLGSALDVTRTISKTQAETAHEWSQIAENQDAGTVTHAKVN